MQTYHGTEPSRLSSTGHVKRSGWASSERAKLTTSRLRNVNVQMKAPSLSRHARRAASGARQTRRGSWIALGAGWLSVDIRVSIINKMLQQNATGRSCTCQPARGACIADGRPNGEGRCFPSQATIAHGVTCGPFRLRSGEDPSVLQYDLLRGRASQIDRKGRSNSCQHDGVMLKNRDGMWRAHLVSFA